MLLLTDPTDEFVIDSLHEYKGKPLKAVDRGVADAGGISDERKQEYRPLLDYLQSKLPDIKEARLTSRLKDSAVCLVSDEGAPSPHVQRLMQQMHRDLPRPEAKRMLEVNPEHPVVAAMRTLHAKDAADARLEAACVAAVRRGADYRRLEGARSTGVCQAVERIAAGECWWLAFRLAAA